MTTKDNVYRFPGGEPDAAPDPGLANRVLDAVNASFRNADFSPLSHYQDHVQCRWNINLGRALSGSRDFIWSDQSWGERHDLYRIGWWKFFRRTQKMKMPWADRFRWIADRLDQQKRLTAGKSGD